MSTTFFNKLKWILGILLVFGLIAATNLVDRSNFAQLSDSVISIYEDRLVAKDIILDVHQFLQEKKIATLTNDADFMSQRNEAINHELELLVDRYGTTALTENETQVFKDLQQNIKGLLAAEQAKSIRKVPIWFVHSKDDSTTKADETVIPIYEKLMNAGAKDVHFSLYDHVVDITGVFGGEDYYYPGHFSWIYSHANKAQRDYDGKPVVVDGMPVTIMQWLAAQKR